MSSATSDLSGVSFQAGTLAPIHGDTGTGGTPSGYASSAGTNENIERVRRDSPRAVPPTHERPSVADRHALAGHLAEALSHAEGLEVAVAAGDAEQAAIAGLD